MEPETDDPIAPLLGAWLCIESEGGVEGDWFNLPLEIRRANPGLAQALDWEGVHLLFTYRGEAQGRSLMNTLLAFVDPSSAPGQIDFLPLETLTDGQDLITKIPKIPGIYRFDDDAQTLQVAIGLNGNQPSFDREPGEDSLHLVYHRIARASQAPFDGLPGLLSDDAERPSVERRLSSLEEKLDRLSSANVRTVGDEPAARAGIDDVREDRQALEAIAARRKELINALGNARAGVEYRAIEVELVRAELKETMALDREARRAGKHKRPMAISSRNHELQKSLRNASGSLVGARQDVSELQAELDQLAERQAEIEGRVDGIGPRSSHDRAVERRLKELEFKVEQIQTMMRPGKG